MVAPALIGRLKESSRTTIATRLQMVRARAVCLSRKARKPQPSKDPARLAPTTASIPTPSSGPPPNRMKRWVPRSGTATAQTATAARLAPATLTARGRIRLVVFGAMYLTVLLVAMGDYSFVGWRFLRVPPAGRLVRRLRLAT
jgi:hypothetical protein